MSIHSEILSTRRDTRTHTVNECKRLVVFLKKKRGNRRNPFVFKRRRYTRGRFLRVHVNGGEDTYVYYDGETMVSADAESNCFQSGRLNRFSFVFRYRRVFRRKRGKMSVPNDQVCIEKEPHEKHSGFSTGPRDVFFFQKKPTVSVLYENKNMILQPVLTHRCSRIRRPRCARTID